eukprot:4256434-Amphidinium_carterae.1
MKGPKDVTAAWWIILPASIRKIGEAVDSMANRDMCVAYNDPLEQCRGNRDGRASSHCLQCVN